MVNKRIVVWFSCGAASAVAAKLARQKYGQVSVVYCNTLASENPDNERFLNDVSAWAGCEITRIGSGKYLTVEDVWEARQYMAGIKGAPCTVELKKVPRFEFQKPDDLNIFGLTYDEPKRITDFEHNNPELLLEWILRDQQYNKKRCLRTIELAGIRLPEMYRLGFDHNNCIGCPKATSPAYWQRTRECFPEVFARRSEMSRRLGARLVRIDGERRFLDEMTTEQDDFPEDIECGPMCAGVKA